MLSIIICSVSQEKLSQVKANIAETIGVEHEVIAIDNLKCKYSITKAYNEGAKQAHFPFLLFVHEDVCFHSYGWGVFLERKLAELDCGVIGFAGSKMFQDVYSGWWQDDDWLVMFLYQGMRNGTTQLRCEGVTLEHPFVEVVSLDGLALFVRREVWEEFLFDEEHLTAFHCYDLDFSLRIAASKKYKNYVCASHCVIIEHKSEGNYNQSWYADTIRMFRNQWKSILPVAIDGLKVAPGKLSKKRERIFYRFIKQIMATGFPQRKQVLLEFLRFPMSWRHFEHCIKAIWLYWKPR